MSIWKRLFGGKEPSQSPQPQPSQPQPSPSKPDGRGTVGFFLFDYGAMESDYGQQAFAAIYEGMSTSHGKCVFHDGDDLRELVPQLLGQADRKKPASPQTTMANPRVYLVGLWTNDISNFNKIHDHLVAKGLPGYLGHLTLPQQRIPEEFGQQMLQWSLPASISLVDGKVVKGTSKYGIGFILNDHNLMLAAMRGQLENVKELIGKGADVNYIDPIDRRSTPLYYAINGGHTEIARILREAGARK